MDILNELPGHLENTEKQGKCIDSLGLQECGAPWRSPTTTR